MHAVWTGVWGSSHKVQITSELPKSESQLHVSIMSRLCHKSNEKQVTLNS